MCDKTSKSACDHNLSYESLQVPVEPLEDAHQVSDIPP